MSDVGLFLAAGSLVPALSFNQIKRQSGWAGLMTMMLVVAALWKVSQGIGWWAAGVFLLAAVIAGALNALWARKAGRAALESVAPINAVAACLLVGLAWLL